MIERVSSGLDTPEVAEVSSPAEMLGAFRDMKVPELSTSLEDLTQAEQNQLYLHVLSLPDDEQKIFAVQYIRNYLWERVSAEIMLDAIFQAEMASPDSVQHHLGAELAHNFSYRFTFDNAATEEAIKGLVDSGDFFRLGVFLDTLLAAYRASQSAPNPGARTGNMRWLVDSIVAQPKVPPLLKLRAESLLSAMENESKYGPTEIYDDIAPFRLSGDTYGWVRGHHVFVVGEGDAVAASQLAEQADQIAAGHIPGDTPTEYTFGNLDAGGEFIPVPTKRTAQSQLYQKTSQLAMEPLSPANLSLVSQKDTLSDRDMYDFAYILSRPVRKRLEVELGVPLAELSLPAQYRFLQFIKQHPDETGVGFDRVTDFARSQGAAGLQAFLALAHGDPDVAEHIFTIAEKLPTSSAQKVFKTYSDIVGAVDQVVNILGDQSDATPERLQSIQTNLYRQGVRLLEKYGTEADTCTDQACVDLGRKLEDRLALAKSSVFAMGAVTRQLVKEGVFDFESFSQLALVQETPPISAEFASQMRQMHQANTEQYPDSLREYWRGTLADSLDSEDAEQKFVYVKMGDDVLAVMRVIDKGDTWYGASFNVNPTIQGSRVGSELLKKVIADMGSQKPFVADVYAQNPMLQNYLDTFGFIITGTEENYHETGAVVHQITWAQPE